MTDVFVSYKAEDRRRVRPLVEALKADGYSVWWDEQIGGGAAWRQAIEAELNIAKCVIVAWSKRSVGPEGTFVQDEATRAQHRHVYVPVTIDKVPVPLGFGEMQALSLTGWKGDRSDARYQAVLAAFQRIAGDTEVPVPHGLARTAVSRRAIVGGGAVAAVAIAGGGAWMLFKPSSSASDSIAVLPFANLSGDPTQSYFSDGIAEELRSALARIARLRVAGRTSSEAVRDEDAKSIARKLVVRNVLTGSMRRSSDVIRVSAQLVDGRSGMERWSEIYDRTAGDALSIQTDIANHVAQALSFNLGEARSPSLTGGTSNPAAHDLYLKALAIRRQGLGEDLFLQAVALFDAAIALDPHFANAHAQKAITLTDLTGVFSDSVLGFEHGYAEAAASARRAIGLAPQLAIGHAALAEAMAGQLDLPGADAEYEKAAATASGNADVITAYGFFLSQTGRAAEGLPLADRAIELDPLNPRTHAARNAGLFHSGRYEEAIHSFERVLQLAKVPPSLALVRIGECHMLLGNIKEAQASFELVPADDIFRLTAESILNARAGNAIRSDERLAHLRMRYGDTAAYQQAEVLAQQGKIDEAFATLSNALTIRDPGLLSLTVDTYLKPLHVDPRFKRLAAKLGFPL